ncbi:MAG: alpha/beta hydrolase [Gemmatimonadaceae bacterium]
MNFSVKSSTVTHRGCNLAYDIQGQGERVLFIQGTGIHGAGWRPQTDALGANYECLWFDNRGMSRSQPRGAAITIGQLAEDARAVLGAAGWESAHVVGHSLGGAIALELALQTPERVKSLSLLCTFTRGSDATKLTLPTILAGIRTRIGTRVQRRRAFLEMIMTPAEMAAVDVDRVAIEYESLFGHDLADSPSIVIPQLSALRAYDATPRLSEIANIPTMIVTAAMDRLSTLAVGRQMSKDMPNARYHELRDTAHGVPIVKPELINALLREHFEHVGYFFPTTTTVNDPGITGA